MSIQQMVAEMQTAPNYVPPITAYTLGRKMYRAGRPYSECITDDMRSGWLAAENAAAWAYYQAMSAEGMAAQAAEVQR